MNQKKGFTIIELLAVITILAIIATITVPMVLDYIGKSDKKNIANSAHGLVDSTKDYYAFDMIETGAETPHVLIFPADNSKLNYKGTEVKSGKLTIDLNGKVKLEVVMKKYCITKDFDETEVTVTEYSGSCSL